MITKAIESAAWLNLTTKSRVAIAFLLYLGLVFASDEGSATIGVVVFVAKGLGFVIQLQGVGL
jgi:hypothetical protein